MAPTQTALYRDLAGDGLQLSWSEAELPERERTKHVHRLHPYLGKFVPQLVEALLGRYVRQGGRVLDPFAGSGTTLVQALESGYDAVGVDVAAFNCLLMRVKTGRYAAFRLERDVRDADSRRGRSRRGRAATWPSGTRRERLRSCSTSARSSTTTSTRTCFASCSPARRARRGSRPTSTSTSRRLRSEGRTGATSTSASAAPWRRRTSSSRATCSTRSSGCARSSASAHADAARASLHGDARHVALEGSFDGVLTSPPYPGLIDYHEQHRYAYELLGLDDRRERELGAAARGTSRAAIEEYVSGISQILRRCAEALGPAHR